MQRLTAYQELRKKQNPEIEARWIYLITGAITHHPTESEPWTCGRMELTREHRSTGAVRAVASRNYQDSNAERCEAYAKAEELTQRWTAFRTFASLLLGAEAGVKTSYRPSLRKSHPETSLLADYYDAAQVEAGDPRRAYRG